MPGRVFRAVHQTIAVMIEVIKASSPSLFIFICGPELQALNTATTLLSLHTWYEGYTQHAQRARVFAYCSYFLPRFRRGFFFSISLPDTEPDGIHRR